MPAIPAIIIAAASIGGAAIASRGQSKAAETAAGAAEQAANTQTASADKALALQKEMFDLQRQDLAPYRAMGAGASGRLGNLWGFPSGQEQLKSEGLNALPGVVAKMGIGTGMPDVAGNLGFQPPAERPANTFANVGNAAFGRQTGSMPATGLTVRLQAPNGAIGDVPSEQAQHYISLGARQIG